MSGGVNTDIGFVTLYTDGTVKAHARLTGRVLTEYSGRLADVREKVLAAAPPGAQFLVGNHRAPSRMSLIIHREDWERLRYDHPQEEKTA